jgi:hypothetical protein
MAELFLFPERMADYGQLAGRREITGEPEKTFPDDYSQFLAF